MSNRRWGWLGVALSLALVSIAGCGAEPNDEATDRVDEALLGAAGGEPNLAAWQNIYSRWAFGQRQVPIDGNGNAVVGDVVLMPLPNTPGDGTPGSAAVTLNARQSFFLPLFTLFGTSYTDGTPPDPFEPVSIFATLDIKFSVDGSTLVDRRNVLRYFSKFEFHPTIPIDSPPIDAVIWLEGVSIFHGPLRPGSHTLKLDVKNTQPAFGGFTEFHNTWNISVRHK